jgi:hypothetical protein
MKFSEIKNLVERQLFRPFALRLSNGAQYSLSDRREFGAPRDFVSFLLWRNRRCSHRHGKYCQDFRKIRSTHQNNLLMMKRSLALVSAFAVLSAIPGKADDVLPPRFNFDRYTRMVDHSPFAIATAVVVPAATPDFAKDLYVANAAHSSEGDMATIASSSDQNFKKYLNTKEPVDGYSIASIEWSAKVGETKVTISKDGKFATLTFNQALLSQAEPTGPPAAGQMPQAVPMIPPPQAGAGQASRAHSRGVIQRNPKAAALPTPNLMPPPVPLKFGPPEEPQ